MNDITALLVVGTLFALYPSANAGVRELPLPRQLRECYQRAANCTLSNFVGALYTWYCEAPLRALIRGTPPQLSAVQQQYITGLYNKVAGHASRGKRQAGTRCIRKEYRVLTDQERNRFHAAVNTLKQETRYNALAQFHTGIASLIAHGGPGFAGWHRVYLLLFEAALQDVDPTVCLPYWDSSMDAWLPNPAQSHIWSSDFLGDGDAEVTTGPFAGWVTNQGVPLRRSVGSDGIPMTRANIELIMSRSTHEEILILVQDPNPQYSLESHHGGLHQFVGGDMLQTETAPNDPLFYLHHAFIDYIWELFRNKMRANGINPETYPVGDFPSFHAATYLMGFGNMTQQEGYLDSLTSSYEYQAAPVCSAQVPDCGSKYLWCNVTQAQCIPVDPRNTPNPTTTPIPNPTPNLNPTANSNPTPSLNTNPTANSNPTPNLNTNPTPNLNPTANSNPTPNLNTNPTPNTDPIATFSLNPTATLNSNPNPNPNPNLIPTPIIGPHLPPNNCPKPKPQACQNNFCINDRCDVNQWVWLPVNIVSQRPPEFKKYQSFPVQNGKISTTNDIYEPSAYSDVSGYIDINGPFPKSYDNCEVTDGVGKIFVTSSGVNYDGFYKESAIIDQRLATSMAVTYIAVKNPAIGGTTQVMLRAHDQCGRICRTACKTGTNPNTYQPCSGVVEVNDQAPYGYGLTYAAATLMTFDYATDRTCPDFNKDDFFVTFYCDYITHIPWVDHGTKIITPTPQIPPLPGPYCQISSQCLVYQPCYRDLQGRRCSQYGLALTCIGNCGRYAVCAYGAWWPRWCPAGLHFNQRIQQCVPGPCQHNPMYQRPASVTLLVPTGPNQYYNPLISRFLPRPL